MRCCCTPRASARVPKHYHWANTCNRLPADKRYTEISPDISVSSLSVTHGTTKTGGTYESSAFFIRNDVSHEEFLFFGDVEPDGVSSKPQTINVWKAAASKIPTTLSAIFIECSWPSGRDDKLLFGHLTPEYLVDELVVLATEVYKFRTSAKCKVEEPMTRARKKKKLNPISLESLQGVLEGVCVYIMHCKGDVGGIYDRPIHQVIADQVRSLVDEKGLGVRVVAVEQGMHIRASFPLFVSHVG